MRLIYRSLGSLWILLAVILVCVSYADQTINAYIILGTIIVFLTGLFLFIPLENKQKIVSMENDLISELENIITNIPSISEIDLNKNENNLVFYFTDKEQEKLGTIVDISNADKLTCTQLFKIPQNRIMASLFTCNQWNSDDNVHNSFSYVTLFEDQYLIALCSHISLQGKVFKDNLRNWIMNFINNVNTFEDHMSKAFQEFGEDREILRQPVNQFVEIIGTLGGAFLRGYLSK